MDTMTKISNSKIHKYSIQGLGVRIPVVFEEDNNLTSDDQMEVYRTTINGRDALILIPAKSNGKSSTEINQTEQAESKQ